MPFAIDEGLLPASRSWAKARVAADTPSFPTGQTISTWPRGAEETYLQIQASRSHNGYRVWSELVDCLYSENIPWEGINSCRRRRTVFLLNCSADSRFTVTLRLPGRSAARKLPADACSTLLQFFLLRRCCYCRAQPTGVFDDPEQRNVLTCNGTLKQSISIALPSASGARAHTLGIEFVYFHRKRRLLPGPPPFGPCNSKVYCNMVPEVHPLGRKRAMDVPHLFK